MQAVQGTPVNINGRTGGTPGPAPSTSALRVDIPLPLGRAKAGLVANGASQSKTFARQLTIRNLDSVDLKVRFYDDTFITVKANTEKDFAGPIPFFSVQAASATAQWEATAVVAA